MKGYVSVRDGKPGLVLLVHFDLILESVKESFKNTKIIDPEDLYNEYLNEIYFDDLESLDFNKVVEDLIICVKSKLPSDIPIFFKPFWNDEMASAILQDDRYNGNQDIRL